MKRTILFLCIYFMSLLAVRAQDSKSIVQPIPIDKSALSGVGLKKIDIKDEPEKDFYQKRLYWGEDLGVFVVGTGTWNNKIKNYAFDEFVYMYQGEAMVKPNTGSAKVFYAGEYFFAPKGFQGEWEIRAGNFIHYELSVITTKRADSSRIKKNPQHARFSKSTLSGNQIRLNNKGTYEELLEKGAEITVKLKGESPTERMVNISKSEQVIHILSGMVKITGPRGKTHQFYTGDFFILPRAFQGTWKSDGHQLVKYLTIERTIWNEN